MNQIELSIRQMQVTDAEELSAIITQVVSSLSYYNETARKSEIEKYSPSLLIESVREDKDSVLIALSGGQIIGFCITYYDDGLIWLSWIGVLPNFRRYKAAEKLLLKMEESVCSRGAHKIWCDCRTVNTASISLLSKLYYRQICTVQNHWYGQDFILWEKPISK